MNIDEQLDLVLEELLLAWHRGLRKRIREGGLDEQTNAKVQAKSALKKLIVAELISEIVKIHTNGYFRANGEIYSETRIAELTDSLKEGRND